MLKESGGVSDARLDRSHKKSYNYRRRKHYWDCDAVIELGFKSRADDINRGEI